MVIALCEMPRLLFIFLLSFHKALLKYSTWCICGNGRRHVTWTTRSALNGLIMLMTCCDPIWTRRLWSSWAAFRRDKMTIVSEDGRRTYINTYIKKGMWNWNQMCACVFFFDSVCSHKCSAWMKTASQASSFLVILFFWRVCGSDGVFLVQLRKNRTNKVST